MIRPGLTTLVSYTPTGADARALGLFGHLSPATYSFTNPGGCDQLTATFYRPPRARTSALDNGRLLRAYRGGSEVWQGILDEPAPGDEGWQITAHGMGGEAVNFRALSTVPWNTGMPDRVVNDAISRGLRWVNPGIGSPSGMWIGQQADEPSQSVADILTMVCTKGGLTWLVRTLPRGNVLSVVPLPTSANRVLIVGDPVARSVAAGPTTLFVRYQTSWDDPKTNTEAQYSWESYTPSVPREQAKGRIEEWTDISSAGVYTIPQVDALAGRIMGRFTRNAFADALPVRYGWLRNLGGTAVDPGVFYAPDMTGMVVRLILADYAPASDMLYGPPEVLIGAYEWNDAEMTGTATPFESIRHDFGSLLSMVTDTLPVREQPTGKSKRAGR